MMDAVHFHMIPLTFTGDMGEGGGVRIQRLESHSAAFQDRFLEMSIHPSLNPAAAPGKFCFQVSKR